MTTEGKPSREPLHRAVRWIEAQRAHEPGRPVEGLVAEAAHRFHLPPVARQLLAGLLGADAVSPPRSHRSRR